MQLMRSDVSQRRQNVYISRVCAVIVVITLALSLSTVGGVILPDDFHKECLGSSLELTNRFGGNSTKAYEWYRNHYENCTHVETNLEITHIDLMNNGTSFNLSFLENIREVLGYVLIAMIKSDVVPLTSLRIIRGLSLYKPMPQNKDPLYDQLAEEGFSLFISSNTMGVIGLRELQLPSLQDILAGHVLFRNNPQLCFDGRSTIDWTMIIREELQRFKSRVFYVENEAKAASCYGKTCDANCTLPYTNVSLCWGSDPDMCQKVVKLNCDPQCNGRCFGPTSGQCCSEACSGGCTRGGPKNCWACRHYNSSGECVTSCPPYEIYIPELGKQVKNPHVKYAFVTQCLDKCPVHVYTDKGACVRSCRPLQTAINESGVISCVDCNGPCPKTCPGTNGDTSSVWGFVNSQNINNFTNCTIVEGSLDIILETFKGDGFHSTANMTVEQLSVLMNVQTIDNYLFVSADFDSFTSLSFLRNLHTIKGQRLKKGDIYNDVALMVHRSSLQSLGLVNLKSIVNGRVVIWDNPNLCFADSINWGTIASSAPGVLSKNKNISVCMCSDRCNPTQGCWGPNDDQCRSCLEYQHVETLKCLETCDVQPMLYANTDLRQCFACHVECLEGCTGGGSDNCTKCAHARDGPNCVAKCAIIQYQDSEKVCQRCYEHCEDGCTGPGSHLGYGGCISCSGLLLDHSDLEDTTGKRTMCMTKDKETCDPGYYGVPNKFKVIVQNSSDPILRQTVKVKGVCRKCHDQCEICDKFGPSSCDICKGLREVHRDVDHEVDKCVVACGDNYYLDNQTVSHTEKGLCRHCHKECNGCQGPSYVQCTACMRYLIYTTDLSEEQLTNYSVTVNDTSFCASKCPDTLTPSDSASGGICLRPSNHAAITSVSVIITVLIITGTVVAALYLRKQVNLTQERKLLIQARMTGIEVPELEDLSPSKVKPDMSAFRLCKESELRRGPPIGSGAFGTVYKGVFIPDRENVKIPVAIKELLEGSNPHSNNELLEEARIMATVIHPCCIRIMAVCFTKQLMLITPLMPFGSLLDYLRRNRSNIGSRILLTWCQQVADGMNYLESLAIVHRDLAARNVLVHSASQIKITDFGLAKLLADEESYLATGGKLPIKWLALECIQHRKFTHKSDVWAYGVTLWEMFTYGQRPYEEIRAVDMAIAIERGERLPQPVICTIDVYMLMIKCWMLDVDSRPTFAELSAEFSKMALDPARYLVIRDDELKRLPSVSPDWKDLMRGMSITCDGSEDLMNAEDYLNPQDFGPTKSPLAGIVEENYENAAFAAASSAIRFDTDNLKASKGDNAKGRSSEYNRELSVRYIKDPCLEEEKWPSVKPAPPPGNGTLNKVASVQNKYVDSLKTDDDGYLATNVIATSAASAADCINGIHDDGYLDNIDCNSRSSNQPQMYVEMSAKTPLIPVENPEYYNPTMPTTTNSRHPLLANAGWSGTTCDNDSTYINTT